MLPNPTRVQVSCAGCADPHPAVLWARCLQMQTVKVLPEVRLVSWSLESQPRATQLMWACWLLEATKHHYWATTPCIRDICPSISTMRHLPHFFLDPEFASLASSMSLTPQWLQWPPSITLQTWQHPASHLLVPWAGQNEMETDWSLASSIYVWLGQPNGTCRHQPGA